MENKPLIETDKEDQPKEVKNGPYKEYFDDGTLKAEVNYNKGLYEGPCKFYWEDGDLREECFYTILSPEGANQSFLDGPCIEWGALNNKMKEYSYIIIDTEYGRKESVYHGEYKEHHYSGELHLSCTYNKGVLDGKYTLFSFVGYKEKECFYINGELDGLYEDWYIPLGYRRDEESDKEYKIKQRIYYKNGEYDGSVEVWYKNGNKKIECFYKDGHVDGSFKEWHKNGNKKIESFYKDGQPDGSLKEWDKDGKIVFEETYNNGVSSKDETRIKSLEKCIDFLYSSQTDGLTHWSEQEYIEIMNTVKYCKELIEESGEEEESDEESEDDDL
jgi:uncharacterized protein